MAVLVFLFTVLPLTEIFCLFRAGQWIGVFPTIYLVLLTGVVGAWVARSEGQNILARMQRELQQGQLPASEILHGFIVFCGGILLVTPGFLTDAFGLFCLFPGTRHLAVAYFKGRLKRGIDQGNIHIFGNHTVFRGGTNSRSKASRTQDQFRNVREVNDVIDVQSEDLDRPRE